MASKVKAKKLRKNFLLPLAVYVFLFSSLLFFCTSVFLKSYNNSLSTTKQNVETQIADVHQENEEASQEISALSSQNRVSAVSQAALSYQAQNIVTVNEGQ